MCVTVAMIKQIVLHNWNTTHDVGGETGNANCVIRDI